MPDGPGVRPARPARRRVPSVVIVNTGDGKGKSTAAFGTMLRAVAQGWPVAVVQFLKSGKWNAGEEAIAKQLGVEWFAAGDGFSWDSTDLDETKAKAVAAWTFAKELLLQGRHRLLILDEVTYPIVWGWVDGEHAASAIAGRSASLNVVLTGRHAPETLIDVADTVTEMRKVKHAYDGGVYAIKGLDF